MKTKLMIIALTFCSSLAVASDGTAPVPEPKKKMMKAPSTDKAQQVDEAVLGNGLSGVGTGGLGTRGTAPAKKPVRGVAPAPTK